MIQDSKPAAQQTVRTAERSISDQYNGPFLQSPFWGSFKSQHGWNNLRYILSDGSDCSVLVRKVPFFGSLAYVPMGPVLDKHRENEYQFLQNTAHELRSLLPKSIFCIRFDPPIEINLQEESQSADSSNSGSYRQNIMCANLRTYRALRKSPGNIQPPDTVLLDLSPSADELLENMKQKWRYNIRLAEKKGVTIRAGTVSDIDIFYKLYTETAERDKIAVHSKEYYRSLLELSEKSADIKVSLFIASHECDDLAAIIVLFSSYEAVYLYGASSNEKRNMMPAYLLQYHAILEAKNYGSSYYDFYGIPPNDDESHPMHGLYRFKTGFGGRIVHRAGSIDAPCSLLYSFYIAVENIRNIWFKKIKKLLKKR